MPFYRSDSPEYQAYENGWNGQCLGTTPKYSDWRLQEIVEQGHRDSQANHGFGRWSVTSELDG